MSDDVYEVRLFGGPFGGEETELPEEHVSRLEPCIRRRFAASTSEVEEHLYKAVPWCTEEGDEAVVYVYENEMPGEEEVEGYIRDGVPIVEFGKYDI
jgi:hypothetical protein